MAAILAEMAEEGVEPDAKETALLDAARQLVNRMAALEEVIATDGEIIASPSGVVKIHPAVSEHRQLAATLPKVLVGIVVGETVAGKDPVKQRAANQRWANRDRRLAAIERQAADG